MLTCKMNIKESAKFNSTCIFFMDYNTTTLLLLLRIPVMTTFGRCKLGSAALWHKAFLNNKWLENIFTILILNVIMPNNTNITN